MQTLKSERHGAVTLIELDRKVINPINLKMVKELSRAIGEVRNDPAVRGLVITSSNEKFFSIGFDIPELFPLKKGEFLEFFRAFNALCTELFTLPKPTVAALTGHAVAGGCVLALCCDYRIMAEGKKSIGLNEIKLGVPVPFLPDCILRDVVGTRHARDIMETGEFSAPDEALRMGLIDQAVPVQQVVPESMSMCRKLGAELSMAYALIKKNRTDPVVAELHVHEEMHEKRFCECWYSEPARARIEDAMGSFKK
jgi:enoyl-CoA hydratase/carnithine racemase